MSLQNDEIQILKVQGQDRVIREHGNEKAEVELAASWRHAGQYVPLPAQQEPHHVPASEDAAICRPLVLGRQYETPSSFRQEDGIKAEMAACWRYLGCFLGLGMGIKMGG